MKKWFSVLVVLFLVSLPVQRAYATACAEFSAPIVAAQLDDPRWSGISGMAASRYNGGVWWVHNDRGSGIAEAGKFYAITTSGTLLREMTLSGVSSLEGQGQGIVDVEDAAVGPGPAAGTYLYLGDIGGNRYIPFGRTSVRIFRLREPRIDASLGYQPPVVLTSYATLTLTYPEGGRYDAESLMVDTNGDIYIVTKDSITGTSKVFHAPNFALGQKSAPLSEVATLQFGTGALVGGLAATAGDISSKGTEAIIRTYSRIFFWQKLPNASWAETFTQSDPCTLPQASPHSYEAVAFNRNGIDIFDTYETTDGNTTIQRYGRIQPMHLPMIKH